MAITVMATPTLHAPKRTARWYLYTVPIAATTLVPTRTEMALSTTYDITLALAGWSGWKTSREVLSANIMGGDVLPVQVDGFRVPGTPEFKFWADATGTGAADIRTILAEAGAYDIEYLPKGDAPTTIGAVWRTTLREMNDDFNTDIDQITCGFNMTKDNRRVTVPA